MADGSLVSRRRVLGTIGIGTIVTLAGCSGDGNGPDNGGSDSTEPTTQGGSGSEKSTTTGSEETQNQMLESSESSLEKQLQQDLLSNADFAFSFIEFGPQSVQLNNKDTAPSGEPPRIATYDLLRYTFRNLYSNWVNEESDIIMFYDKENANGEIKREIEHSVFIYAISPSTERSDLRKQQPNTFRGYRISAIRKFLRDDISGVKDVSENFPEDLLELAQT